MRVITHELPTIFCQTQESMYLAFHGGSRVVFHSLGFLVLGLQEALTNAIAHRVILCFCESQVTLLGVVLQPGLPSSSSTSLSWCMCSYQVYE